MRFFSLCLLQLLIISSSAVTAADYTGADRIRIHGAVLNPLELSVADIEQMATRELKGIDMRCSETRVKSKNNHYKGVLLRDILEQAEIDITNHHQKSHLYLVVRASDDYVVLFSWHEVANSPLGDQVMVYLERNGEPLDDTEGPLALISAADTFKCTRHVKWLESIEVVRFAAPPHHKHD